MSPTQGIKSKDFFAGLCSFFRYFSTLNLYCDHLKPTQNL